eukprot:1157869-Pelagomonas_calceolata.AAC.5
MYRFDSPLGFEPTPEVAIFDLLGITLIHGWLVDPMDARTTEALGSRSYNEVGLPPRRWACFAWLDARPLRVYKITS